MKRRGDSYDRGDGPLYLQWVSMYMGAKRGFGGGRVALSQRGASGAIQLFITPQTEGGRGGESGLHQKHMHMTTPTLTSLQFQTPTSGDTHSHTLPCIHFLVILGKKNV